MAFAGSAVAQLDAGAVLMLATTVVVFFIPVLMLFPPVPAGRSDALRQTHSKLGLRESRLRTQFSPDHGPRDGRAPRIQSLFVYPVKSCRGIELARSRVLASGLEHDRLYTLAQPAAAPGGGESWDFVTMRQLPRLANVKVDVWLPDAAKTSRQLGCVAGGFVVLRFPWVDGGLRGLGQRLAAKLSRGLRAAPEKDVMLPLEFPSRADMAARGYEHARVRVWNEVVSALNMESELPPELAVYLGARRRLALFRIDPANARPVPSADARGCPPVVHFQDAYPVHMLSLASVRALEARIRKDANLQRLDARRFRANIFLSGAQEYDEDNWKAVRFENPGHGAPTVFDVSCRTIRCKMPNVNPDTGVRHRSEPDHALRTYRNVDESAPKLGCLGVQLCPVFPAAGGPECPECLLEVGMEAQVQRRGSHGGLDQEAGAGLEQAKDATKEQNGVP